MRTKLSTFSTFVALVIGCLAFVPSTSLSDANSREGCMNQWLFNGVWRARVTKVEPLMNGSQQIGWMATEVWRNGTSQELSPFGSALQDQVLELQHGSLKASDTMGPLNLGQLMNNSIAPSGQLTYKQGFIYNGNGFDPSNKPQGLLVVFNGSQLARNKSEPQFTTSKYNFDFNLGCVATGAVANAEGGSTQINATEGCLNQWMSNGIWKMRVTAISGYQPDQPPQNQSGWTVTQTWVNVTHRGIWPTGLYTPGTAPSNVSDEFIATQSGNNVSSYNVAGGLALGKRNVVFPPGTPYTWSQLFVGGGLVGTDKPVRLLVTFDSKSQNALSGMPHYHMPANFRINLTCTK